jgi:hypothetical protein
VAISGSEVRRIQHWRTSENSVPAKFAEFPFHGIPHSLAPAASYAPGAGVGGVEIGVAYLWWDAASRLPWYGRAAGGRRRAAPAGARRGAWVALAEPVHAGMRGVGAANGESAGAADLRVGTASDPMQAGLSCLAALCAAWRSATRAAALAHPTHALLPLGATVKTPATVALVSLKVYAPTLAAGLIRTTTVAAAATVALVGL